MKCFIQEGIFQLELRKYFHNTYSQVYGNKDNDYYCEPCYLEMEAKHCGNCKKVKKIIIA